MSGETRDAVDGAPREELRESIGMLLDLEKGTPGVLARGLKEFRPVEIAEVLHDFDSDEKMLLLSRLPREMAAEVITETDPVTQSEIVETTPGRQMSEFVEALPPDEGVDLLEHLSDRERKEVLGNMEPEQARELERLKNYDPESAGGLMTTRFATIRQGWTVDRVLASVRSNPDLETFHYAYVVDEGNVLKGVVTAREIVSAHEGRTVGEIMEDDVVSVKADEDQETVAALVRKYNLSALPVVDDAGRLVGMVTVDDIIDVIDEEFSEDIYRLAGTAATHPTREPVWRRVILRLPWLLVTLTGGLVVAIVGSKFERGLESLAIMFFWPAVNAMGGNVGIQSSTMIVRGLATGEVDLSRLMKILLAELKVGALIGVSLGGLVVFLVYAMSGVLSKGAAGSPDGLMMGVTVGTAMLMGVMASALVGTIIPVACWRIGIDPAITAGPFVTVLNDVFCTAIFFTVATLVLVKGG